MPGDDVSLTPAQCAEIEHRLAELDRKARAKIRETAPKQADEKGLERAGNALDEGDESVSIVEEDLNHALHERCLDELRHIESARERSASGEIDSCADCGGEIAFERLLAHPLATRCIHCQLRHERTHRAGATPRL